MCGASQFEHPLEDIDDEDAMFGQQPSAVEQPSNHQASSRHAWVACHMENESPVHLLPMQVLPTKTPAALIAADAVALPVQQGSGFKLHLISQFEKQILKLGAVLVGVKGSSACPWQTMIAVLEFVMVTNKAQASNSTQSNILKSGL